MIWLGLTSGFALGIIISAIARAHIHHQMNRYHDEHDT